MAAYLLGRVTVNDPGRMKEYQSVVPAIVEKYRGRFIARGGSTVTLEGPADSRRIVLIEFPELSDAQAFYHSPEYSAARELRKDIAVVEFIAVEGIRQSAG